jgi:hypothetical protein
MFRRRFITALTFAGVIQTNAKTSQTKVVTYRVEGFSCITCAVGLDTMLLQHMGVVHSKSSYPDALTTIEFQPSLVNEESLKAFISEMGFTAC